MLASAKHSSAKVIDDEMERPKNNDVTAAAENQLSFAMSSLDSALNTSIADNTVLALCVPLIYWHHTVE